MTAPYKGGCACGAIRYETHAEPVFQNHCQCNDCQKSSGTGHGSYLSFSKDDVTLTGKPSKWGVIADSGNEKFHAFCPVCGTPVYLTFAAMPMIAIHAATLDDPGLFTPQALTYASRGHAWDRVDPAMQKFDRMPG